MDTLLCSNKEEAKEYGDTIGWKFIADWEFLDNGKVKLIMAEGWKDERADDNL